MLRSTTWHTNSLVVDWIEDDLSSNCGQHSVGNSKFGPLKMAFGIAKGLAFLYLILALVLPNSFPIEQLGAAPSYPLHPQYSSDDAATSTLLRYYIHFISFSNSNGIVASTSEHYFKELGVDCVTLLISV